VDHLRLNPRSDDTPVNSVSAVVTIYTSLYKKVGGSASCDLKLQITHSPLATMSAAMGLQILLAALAGQASAQSAEDRAARYFPDCVNGPLSNNTICDTSADPLTRATALVKAMTLEEKFANTDQNQPGAPRIGLPPYIWWNEALHGVAEQNGVQFEEEGEWSHATSFPQPILTGAAFDDELVHKIATVISTEFRAFGNNLKAGLQAWTPNINPYRDPRWGR
jgi:beta-D-xylosidase 4